MEKFKSICPEKSEYGTIDNFIDVFKIEMKSESRI